MHMRNRPPVFVPDAYRFEIESLSKAALMDIAWDYATQMAASPEAPSEAGTMKELRARIEIITTHRKAAIRGRS